MLKQTKERNMNAEARPEATTMRAARRMFTLAALRVSALLLASVSSATAAAWEQDFRRCRVIKAFDGGNVILSAGERTLELDIHWADDKSFDNFGDAAVSVRIDRSTFPRPVPLRSDVGMVYGYRLASLDAGLRALSHGKRLTVTVAGEPSRTVDLDIGAGREAASFLRKCDIYWTSWRRKQR